MTSNRECFVYIVPPNETEFVTAGKFRLSHTRNGEPVGEFVYGRSYLARQNAVELDPVELKLTERQYQSARLKGFFGAIRDAMPDYWGRLVIEKHAGKAILDDFDYLMHGPDDRAGALGFGLNPTPPSPRRQFNQTLDLEKLQATADAIQSEDTQTLEGSELAAQVEELLLAGTSMGGMRPKAVVEDGNGLWIAKFSTPTDKWNQAKVEHAMLQLAKTCGIQTAESKITQVAGRDVLLVKRFDREKTDTGYLRHRMVSALTMLRADDSSTNRHNWSYLLLADEVRRSSIQPEADLKDLFLRMCFNAAISNLDDHPRNHAMLGKQKGWHLSPAYDLTPSPVIAEDERHLAMHCGTDGVIARKSNLLSACKRFLLSQDEAQALLEHIVHVVNHEWDNCLARAGVSFTDAKTIQGAKLYPGFFYDNKNNDKPKPQ